MTAIRPLITAILLLSAGTAAAAFADPPFDGAGKMTDTVICQADHAQSYALYIPANSKGRAMPLLFFFDPHGDGAYPLHKYRSLADRYGFILAGSNNSRNGNDGAATENIWRRLLEDLPGRYPIDRQRIYACGFSGGAKVAGYLALQHPVIRGVIAGGAGLPDGTPAGSFPFSLTAIAGEGDINLTELVTLSNALDKTPTRHRILFFNGKHEWAPPATMDIAFAGLQFDAMKAGTLPKDQSFIDRYGMQSRQRLDLYTRTHRLLKAMQECSISISLLDGLTDQVGWFSARASALLKNAAYVQQRQAADHLLAREQEIKAGYGPHFQQDDGPYWAATIRDLQTRSDAGTAEGAMYQRLLAYLSLAFYSISHQLIEGNQNKDARHFVEWYKLADPSNSEAWYFSAILHAREGQAQAAANDLRKAADHGFRDKGRMDRQPEFRGLPGMR